MTRHHYSFVCRALSLLSLWLLTQSVFAGPVEESAARKVAQRFVSAVAPLRASGDELTLVLSGETHPATALRSGQQAALYYIYSLGEGNGFVIISGEDTAYPILGYATEGIFRTDQMPDNLTHWLSFYQKEMIFAIESGLPATDEIIAQWHNPGERASLIQPAVLLPTANWDQSAPYNNLCPTDALGKTSVTGCVATAMGIVMKHYNWPEKGTGMHTYRTKTDSIRVTASFNTSYDWGNMLDKYTQTGSLPNWTTTQGEAVATLLFHCGVSVDMNYTSKSSGAYTNDVITALVDHFDYDKSISLLSRDLYSSEEWMAIVRAELDLNYPLMYGGATEDMAGHFFIIDGYATTEDYFHVNWGWSGYSDGYYRLSSLAPTYQGIGGSTPGAGYSYLQDVVVGMRRAESGSYINNELYFYVPQNDSAKGDYGLYLKDTEYILRNEPFLLCYTYFADYGWRDFHGEIGVFHEDKNQMVKDTLDIMVTDEKGLPAGYSYYDNEGMELTVKSEVDEGDRIRMYYRPEGHDWRPLRGEPGTVSHLAVYNESPTNTTVITQEETIRTTMEAGKLLIHFSPGTEIRQVKAYTLQGQEVVARVYQSNVSPIVADLSDFANRALVVTIQTAEGVISRKVIPRK
ncbi:C10 family peptidase [Parabacteroides sp. PF5-6]|uniref:C10 family peptidase n=1 Tax=Parabacteroides sp. PF5-6 TaxID=1742403 RepID=UPI00240700AF|nr:C10 family peptidase [Parabacteroides sp. PF5-6]MDF9831322.1 hypothetical protein [Parabacteroides sp. PF5-6]